MTRRQGSSVTQQHCYATLAVHGTPGVNADHTRLLQAPWGGDWIFFPCVCTTLGTRGVLAPKLSLLLYASQGVTTMQINNNVLLRHLGSVPSAGSRLGDGQLTSPLSSSLHISDVSAIQPMPGKRQEPCGSSSIWAHVTKESISRYTYKRAKLRVHR